MISDNSTSSSYQTYIGITILIINIIYFLYNNLNYTIKLKGCKCINNTEYDIKVNHSLLWYIIPIIWILCVINIKYFIIFGYLSFCYNIFSESIYYLLNNL